MIEADRLITPEASTEDEVIDRAIRPKMLEDYTGQPHVCEQMEIFIFGRRVGPALRRQRRVPGRGVKHGQLLHRLLEEPLVLALDRRVPVVLYRVVGPPLQRLGDLRPSIP